jgi:hypothetical protein
MRLLHYESREARLKSQPCIRTRRIVSVSMVPLRNFGGRNKAVRTRLYAPDPFVRLAVIPVRPWLWGGWIKAHGCAEFVCGPLRREVS